MDAATTIPVSMTPEAAQRAADLWMRPELDRMIEQAKQAVPDLKLLEVTLTDNMDERENPAIVITGWTRGDRTEEVEAGRSVWYRWAVDTFPPSIFRWFSLVTYPWEYHER